MHFIFADLQSLGVGVKAVLDTMTFGTFSPTMGVLKMLIVQNLTTIAGLLFIYFHVVLTAMKNACHLSIQYMCSTTGMDVSNLVYRTTSNLSTTMVLLKTNPCVLEDELNFFTGTAQCSDSNLPTPTSSIQHAAQPPKFDNYKAFFHAIASTQSFLSGLSLIMLFDVVILLLAVAALFWLYRYVSGTGGNRQYRILSTLGTSNASEFPGYAYLIAAYSGFYHALGYLSESYIAAWIFKYVAEEQMSKQIDIPQTVPEMVARIRLDRQHIKQLLEDKHRQESQFDALNAELAKARLTGHKLDHDAQELREALSKRESLINQLQSQVKSLSQKRQKEQNKTTASQQQQIAALNDTVSRERSSMMLLTMELNDLKGQCAELSEAKMETQFENELLKCTSTGSGLCSNTSVLSRFAVPFVLVLVDGDAYSWATSHFAQNRYAPGAIAAQAIKNEVQQYLIENRTRIPIQSRIAVRVYKNINGADMTSIRAGRHARGQTTDFLRDFGQSMPLFDYIDSGRGKERADSKIQETTHLFIANPCCHAIFLATATDNGFARLLEQYACDDEARGKIVLVHPGYIAHEIEALHLQAVQWPSVFQDRALPAEARQKAAYLAATEAKRARDKEIAAVRTVVEDVSGLGAFRDLSRVHPWASSRVGLRMTMGGQG